MPKWLEVIPYHCKAKEGPLEVGAICLNKVLPYLISDIQNSMGKGCTPPQLRLKLQLSEIYFSDLHCSTRNKGKIA